MKGINEVGCRLALCAMVLPTACSGVAAQPTLPVAAPGSWPSAGIDPGRLLIHTLPVGAGNCQIVQCPEGNKIIVMDCGSGAAGSQNWSADTARAYVRGLVNAETDIAVSVSHPHVDSYRYLPRVLDDVPVRTLYISRQIANYNADFQSWARNQQVHAGMNVVAFPGFYASTVAESGLSCWADNGRGGKAMDVASYILGVNTGTGANEGSMVVAMRYGSFQSLFTGNMTAETEAGLRVPIALGSLRSQLLTSPNHGSTSHGSNSATWADATRPSLVLFSTGIRFHHPRCESVNVYAGYVGQNSALHRLHCGDGGGWHEQDTQHNLLTTDSNGLIRVTASNDGTYQFGWGL